MLRTTAAATGIVAIALLPQLPPLWLWALLLLPLGVLAMVGRLRLRLVALYLGGLYAALYGEWRLAQLLPEQLEKRDLPLNMEVVSLPEWHSANGGYYRFDARLLAGQCYSEAHCPPGRPLFRLNWYRDSPPIAGSHWLVHLRLRQPRGYASPGAFDYGRWLFARGYSGLGYVRNEPAPQPIYLNPAPGKEGMTAQSAGEPSLRQRLMLSLREVLAPYAQQGVMRALLFADREDLTPQQWQVFSATGTSHLMAISGMHIGMALSWGLVIGWLARLWVRPARWRLWATLSVGGAAALGYAWLAGFTLPTQRALIMTAVALWLLAHRRLASPWSAWCLALCLVLLWQPLAVHQAGFWMSFIAVACLILGLDGQRSRRPTWYQLVHSQAVVVVGMVPLLTVWGFGVSPWAIPANLLAIPTIALVVLPLLLLGLLGEWLPGVEPVWLWTAADWTLGALQRILATLAQFKGVWQPPLSPMAWLATLLAVILFLLPRGLPGRLLALPLLLAALFWPAERPASGRAWVHVLDVGQGLAVWVQTAGHDLLYDLGPAYESGFNTADTVVLPALHRAGVSRINSLVISHSDSDHLGDIDALLAAIDVDRGVYGERWPGQPADTPWAECHRASPWQWDGVDFRFLRAPVASDDNNNRSCVLRIDTGDAAVLLPGDIEAQREGELLRRYGDAMASDLLVAPHHGSATSSSPGFVAAVDPAVVVFSAGYKHAYGHPAAVVKRRFSRRGACALSTADHGTVSVELGDEGLSLLAWGRQRRYYWQPERAPPCLAAER